MILFASYLRRLLRRRRAFRGAPPPPHGGPALARMVVEELALLLRSLTGRASAAVSRKVGQARLWRREPNP